MNNQPIAILNYKNGYQFIIDDIVYFNRWIKYTSHKWLCENPDSMGTMIFNEK